MTSPKNKLAIWLEATRPKTLPAALIPVILGAAISSKAHEISFFLLLLTLLTSLFIQITTNYVNDLCDFLKGSDREDRTGPRRATAAGLVSPQEMKKACFIVVFITCILGGLLSYYGGLPIFIIGVLSIISAIAYTAGPYPLAYLGLGDIFVFIFFGLVATSGTDFIFSGEFSKESIVSGVGLGAISTAILVVNNLRDFEQDKKSLKITLIVRFGKFFGKVEFSALLLIAALCPLYFFLKLGSLVFLLPLVFLFPASFLLKNIWNEENLNSSLAATAKLLALYGALFSAAWLFS